MAERGGNSSFYSVGSQQQPDVTFRDDGIAEMDHDDADVTPPSSPLLVASGRQSRRGRPRPSQHPMTLRGERNLELTGPGVAQPIQSQSQRSFQVTVSNDSSDTTRDVSDRSRQSSSGTTVRIIDGTSDVTFQSGTTFDPTDVDGLSFDRATDVMAGRRRSLPRGDYSLPNLPHQGLDDNEFMCQRLVRSLDCMGNTSLFDRPPARRGTHEMSRSSLAEPSVAGASGRASSGSEKTTSRPSSAADEVKSLADSMQRLIQRFPPSGDAQEHPHVSLRDAEIQTSRSKLEPPITDGDNSSDGDRDEVSRSRQSINIDHHSSDETCSQHRPIFNPGRGRLPTFDGTDFAVFKRLFEANARTFCWSETECLQNLLNALRGDARNIMALLDDDVVTYASLFAALEDRYGARLSYTDVVEELRETKRAWRQNLHDFAVQIKRVLRKADLDDVTRSRLARQYFVQGLPVKSQRAYINRKDPSKTNIMVALNLAVQWENRNEADPEADRRVDHLHTHYEEVGTRCIENTTSNLAQDKITLLEKENAEMRQMIEETKRILEDVMERQARAATATLAARGSSDAPRRQGHRRSRNRRPGYRYRHPSQPWMRPQFLTYHVRVPAAQFYPPYRQATPVSDINLVTSESVQMCTATSMPQDQPPAYSTAHSNV